MEGYGLLFSISTLVAVLGLAMLLRFRNQNPGPAIDLTILLILGHVIGARVFYAVLTRDWTFFSEPGVSKFRSGFWGGQLGFALLGGLYLLWTRAPFRPLADALAVTWAFVSVPQKIGCFLAGCCYGSQTSVPWAVVFPPGGQCRLSGLPLHPTQLYDAGLGLIAGAILLNAYLRGKGEGRLLLWWGLLYAVSKYATEWIRGDHRFVVAGSVTASMLIELATAVSCAYLLSFPAIWDFLLALRDRRTAEDRVPESTVRRGVSFAMTLANVIAALMVSGMVAGKAATPGSVLPAYMGYYVVASILSGVTPVLRVLGLRVVTSAGSVPSLPRLVLRGLYSSVSVIGLFGLFRPLLDRSGRGLGDAMAGTWLVRKASPRAAIGT